VSLFESRMTSPLHLISCHIFSQSVPHSVSRSLEEDMKLVKLCGENRQDCVDWRIGIRGDRLTSASTEKQTLKR